MRIQPAYATYTFFFYSSRDHRHLDSFPTRRSSDLLRFRQKKWHIMFPKDWTAILCGEISANLQKIAVQSDRKSTRLNSSHVSISYADFSLKKKNKTKTRAYRRPKISSRY